MVDKVAFKLDLQLACLYCKPKRFYCIKTDEVRNENRFRTLDHLPTGGITNFRRNKTKSVNQALGRSRAELKFSSLAGILFEPEMKLGPGFSSAPLRLNLNFFVLYKRTSTLLRPIDRPTHE